MDPKETREIEIVLKAQAANASIKDMGAGVALLNNQLAKMTADDPRRAALKRDFDVLSQRVGEARKELKTYVMTEEEARLAAEKLNAENQQVILNGQKVNSSFKDMRASAALLEQQLHEMNGDEPGRKKLIADYHALQDRIEGVSHELTRANKNTSFFKEGLANAFAFATGGGIEALAEKVVEVGKDVFDTTAKFETFETVLTNALGDRSKAKQALADIQDMAAKTPFSVEELTGSFIKFVNRGITPSMEQLTKMGDIAASQGKSFDQLTEAVLDAGTGEFERLKEFGISASKSGDQVSLSFKGITQSVKNTPEAINGAILKFGEMKGVAGNMAAVSKTLDGVTSNLGDTFGQLEVKVGGGLKPVFVLLLGLLGQMLGWVGRFVEQAGPLKVIFAEIMDVFMDLYHDIGDVLESLGLFSDKTDTVKLAVEALKFVLTMLALPIKTVALAARGIVDTFIDWYNKSELLRGILGGLGAVAMSLFRTIRDDAMKYLGGVADFIVGIFTLDKDKIMRGLKATLDSTADLALSAGDRAAAAFSTGYLANKDNRITRTVRVKTQTEEEGGPSTAGVDLKSDPSAGDSKKAEAAAKKAKTDRDRRDREHLADLKKWVKDEGDILDQVSELDRARQAAANTDELKRREAQRQKIIAEASKKYQALLVLDGNHTLELAAVLTERDLKLRELAAKFAEDDEKQKQQDLEAKRKTIEAETQEAIGALENTHALGLVNEQEYQEQLYYLRKKGLEDQLALLVAAGQGESDAAKKIQAGLLKLTADRVTSEKKQQQDLQAFDLKMAAQSARMLADGLKLVEDNLDQKGEAYAAFKALRKTAEIAELGINLAAEIQAIWKSAAENPLNGVTGGAAGTVQGTIQTGLAVARATAAGIRIAGFAQGGFTGEGTSVAMLPGSARMWDVVRDATGLAIGPNGKLQDAQGLEVAGIVHQNEYVIPEWMRADPQVLQVENWLEARRLRGYAQGGATSDGGQQGTKADMLPSSDEAAGNARLVQVLNSLDQRLQKVEEWPTQLEVVLDLLQLDRDQQKLKNVKSKGGINP